MNTEHPSPSSASDVNKKRDQTFYDFLIIVLGFIPVFLGILTYSCVSQYFEMTSINIIIFQFFNLSFIFLCSNIFTASVVFPASKPTSSSVFKRHLITSLWLCLGMVGFNINSSLIPVLIYNSLLMDNAFSFPEVAFVLFLVMNAYVFSFYLLAATEGLWVFEAAYGFADMKRWIELLKGKFWMTYVVMCGLFAVGFLIKSTLAQQGVVFVFANGIMMIVGVIMKQVFKVLAHVWKDMKEIELKKFK